MSIKDGETTPKNAKPQPEPKNIEKTAWNESVDGYKLFQDLTAIFSKYLVLRKYQPETLALWSIFSHCYDANHIAPKLLIHSPEKRCGKTTLIDVLNGLVWKPLSASNITPAVMFRVIEDFGGTIMIDEADTFLDKNQELNGIINSGHRKTQAFVWRCQGDNHEPKKYSTWAPTVIAMIGKPADTIIDRSIIITMHRKTPDEHADRFIYHKAQEEFELLSRKIMRWAKDNFDDLRESDPSIPDGLNDRAADNWRPLLAIADLIGKDCTMIARLAATELNATEDDEDNISASTKLLIDIQKIFKEQKDPRIPTEDLLFSLHGLEDSPWRDWNHGRAITAHQLARRLRPFGINSKKIRFGEKTLQGYEQKQFEDAFARYLAGTTEPSNNNNGLDISRNGTVPEHVPDTKITNHLKNNNSSGVPAISPDSGRFREWFEKKQRERLTKQEVTELFDE